MKVEVERDGPVTIVTINRPERRNAVDPETALALRSAFSGFEADGDSEAPAGRADCSAGTPRTPARSNSTGVVAVFASG